MSGIPEKPDPIPLKPDDYGDNSWVLGVMIFLVLIVGVVLALLFCN